MINKFSPELFAQRPVRSDYKRGGRRTNVRYRRLAFLGVLVMVALSIGYGIFVYLEDDIVLSDDIPHIKAAFPIKERPINPGGIDIPHQDLEVFNQLDKRNPAQVKGAVEHLLPVTALSKTVDKKVELGEVVVIAPKKGPLSFEVSRKDIPIPSAYRPDGLPPAINEAVIKDDTVPLLKELPEIIGSAKIAKNTPKIKITKIKIAKVKIVKKSVLKLAKTQQKKAEQAMAHLPAELFTGKLIPEKKIVETSVKTAMKKETIKNTVVKKITIKKTGILARVQIASFPQEFVARREIKRYSQRFASSLKGAKLEVIRVDISQKGIYYRIMTQMLDKVKAIRICDDMKKKKGSCLVKM